MNKIYNQFKKIGKKVAPYILTGVLTVGGYGCANNDNHFVEEGKFRGYPTKAGIGTSGRRVTIYPDSLNSEHKLSAVDTDNNGRFDEIYLRNLKKGHTLEQYVHPDSLEMAYNEIVKND